MVAILALAVAVRLAFVVATPHWTPTNDPADYQRLAISVAHGHGFGASAQAPGGGPTAFRPPLYPLALGAFYAVVGVRVCLARVAQAVIGAASVGLVGLLAVQLFGRRTAAISMTLAALYPPLVLDGGALISESLAIPLELGAVCSAVEVDRSAHPLAWSALAGLLAGLGILNRPNTAVLLVPLLFLVAGRPSMETALL